MTILIEKEVDKELPFEVEPLVKIVIEKTLEEEACPYEVEVNLLLTGNEEIRQTNREFRKIDKETDVLSFPAVDYESPADFSLVDASPESYLNPENDELLLGDIMISVDKVFEQAKEYNHSVKREFAFLIVHSTLHLLGYDHMEEEERVVMEEKQEFILKLLGIERE